MISLCDTAVIGAKCIVSVISFGMNFDVCDHFDRTIV